MWLAQKELEEWWIWSYNTESWVYRAVEKGHWKKVIPSCMFDLTLTPLCTTSRGYILSYIWLGPAAMAAHIHPSWTSQRTVYTSRTCKCYTFSNWKVLKVHAAGRMLGASVQGQDSLPSLGRTKSCKGEDLAKGKGKLPFLLDFHCQQKKGEISTSFQLADKGWNVPGRELCSWRRINFVVCCQFSPCPQVPHRNA